MRIVGGRFKGRKLVSFLGEAVRPTSDQARESLFNILQFQIAGKSFLDLFAGTGAVGIEAYSRGASRVLLNDKSKDSISIIKKNLALVNTPKEIQVTNFDAKALLSLDGNKFDFIFMDPPYGAEITKEALLLTVNALTDNGIVILESEEEFLCEVEGLAIYDKRKYGRARFTFFRRS